MPTIRLTDRAVILISGPDAEHLVQNVVTTDIDALKAGEIKPGALLTPQGKILFDFLVSRTGDDGIRLDVQADAAADFAKRLMLYRLRAKADISVQDEAVVSVAWENDSAASETDSSPAGLLDTRFRALQVWRRYDAEDDRAVADPAVWTQFRIVHGVAESGSDYALGDAFPHDVLLDQNGGIGFQKGCYVGQEVVSRMQHRGTARRRVLIAHADTPLPPSGTAITVGGRAVGTLGSVSGSSALAPVRIDRVKDAIDAATPILAGDTEISLTIPSWATFGFPETAAADGT